ncbi:ABC transporter permease [Lysobacter enzymogenes]|uniref:ABC transporter permease n=1 Tax=Lysobacter enzymogenes TaxID=69 RepID=UPI001A976FAB|nr:ABC transporter permease [Lysobacter enzymogenes]QQP97969.1 ABC transporter permease [Lysobacter enzymogenes]
MNASYAHLAPATVILGGAGTLALTASGEFSTPGAQAASILGGLALLGLLALLWWVNVRAARYRAWASARYPAPAPQKGGFWLGAGLGLVAAFALQALALVVAKSGVGPEGLRFLAMVWVFVGFLGYGVFPLLFGYIGRIHRATRIRS